MENQRSRQLQVGIFLAVGLFAVLASILALGGDKSIFHSYTLLYSKMPQVQGLNKGSIVSLSGLTIGNVKDIEFTETPGILRIAMKVDKAFLKRVPKDSTIDIRTQGALGDKFVYIQPGTSELGSVSEEGYLNPENGKDFMGILTERGGEAGRVFDIMKELHALLLSMNSDQKIEKIMTNTYETTHEVKLLAADARKILLDLRGDNQEKLKKTVDHLNSILTKIDKGEGTLGLLVNDSSLHQQLKTLIGESPRKQYMQSVLKSTIEKSEH